MSVMNSLNERVETLVKDQLNGLLSDDELSALVKEKVDKFLEEKIPEKIQELSYEFFQRRGNNSSYGKPEHFAYFETAFIKTLKEKTDNFTSAISNDPRWNVSISEKGYPIMGDFLKELLAIDPSAIPDVATIKNSFNLAKNIVNVIAQGAVSSAYNNGNYDPSLVNLSNCLMSMIANMEMTYMQSIKEPMLLPKTEDKGNTA